MQEGWRQDMDFRMITMNMRKDVKQNMDKYINDINEIKWNEENHSRHERGNGSNKKKPQTEEYLAKKLCGLIFLDT